MDGNVLSERYRQEWLKGQKYPVIHYPSGLDRELCDSAHEGGILHIFGACELLRKTSPDDGYANAAAFAAEHNLQVAKVDDNKLRIAYPETGHGYEIQYDIGRNEITNVMRFPEYAMELLDGQSRAALIDLYQNEAIGLDAVAPLKFFTPDSNWTWYPTEHDGEDLFFGLVSGFEVELGYFSLSELENVRGPLGLPIERDLYYAPQTLRELQNYERQLKRL